MYNSILKLKEWLIISCVISVAKRVLPTFYVFKGEHLKGLHQNVQVKYLHGNAKKGTDSLLLIQNQLLTFHNALYPSIFILND